ncbi:uncharacterized protein Z519_05492 [Cladophialophora bantiana CBS 173.52]|uniref:Uncharacterized protein n=1 Tax=Cladophialophora bantiana (strain ATCC 10958 / CBS 173.52 / CDC B-1940 / NIH 8579) TaxID=1442370 RepID=A0A0D2EWE9_CLAB1|nr:uncharacterized protein Z519_05492 [Cladophialophora bantiana CBS 173.52]KIW94176.1 hypothetical protein Z519_05492 [Cladophialophora bantiana CBS 173.52]
MQTGETWASMRESVDKVGMSLTLRLSDRKPMSTQTAKEAGSGWAQGYSVVWAYVGMLIPQQILEETEVDRTLDCETQNKSHKMVVSNLTRLYQDGWRTSEL